MRLWMDGFFELEFSLEFPVQRLYLLNRVTVVEVGNVSIPPLALGYGGFTWTIITVDGC